MSLGWSVARASSKPEELAMTFAGVVKNGSPKYFPNKSKKAPLTKINVQLSGVELMNLGYMLKLVKLR